MLYTNWRDPYPVSGAGRNANPGQRRDRRARLEKIADRRLDVLDVDMLEGTPLLDIKPYVPSLDIRTGVRRGWFTGKEGREKDVRSDDRFA